MITAMRVQFQDRTLYIDYRTDVCEGLPLLVWFLNCSPLPDIPSEPNISMQFTELPNRKENLTEEIEF
ncbi:hypothetical protein NECAME_12650 [Necator americanus]|uniref:Uncharacterized protein n=1 Tax=Necator americanus TaxID=51031 RepID=W2T1Q1_NECAM|nr:hypothetical protein NECAME_12650 [Necator americanus]ETN74902.1 hypothetical protein NECAME_12650 [Necator americanus]